MLFRSSVTITATCTVANGTLAFGSQAASALSANIDATGTFTVNCTNNANYAITMDNGVNASGVQRRMNDGGTGYLNYNLYSDAGRTTSWGSVSGTATGANQTISVYGRIPSGQTATAGSYSDTVQFTVTY